MMLISNNILLFICLHCIIISIYGYVRNVKTINRSKLHVSTQKNTLQIELSKFLANGLINSPIYPIIKIQAKNTMISTGQKLGLDWKGAMNKLQSLVDWEAVAQRIKQENSNVILPDYYIQNFHAYEKGNLCKESAIEQDFFGVIVAAKNFPESGRNADNVFRERFETSMNTLGLTSDSLVKDSVIVDMGCGAGKSTRRLARYFPLAKSIIGIDLSPYMISVARYLNEEGDKLSSFGVDWPDDVTSDKRLDYRFGDLANTMIEDSSVDLASYSFVHHELPADITKASIQEAYRILKPGGIFMLADMDPNSESYRKFRKNPFVFSLIRSTEPWLDEYFDIHSSIPDILGSCGFVDIKSCSATNRHSVIIATKP